MCEIVNVCKKEHGVLVQESGCFFAQGSVCACLYVYVCVYACESVC